MFKGKCYLLHSLEIVIEATEPYKPSFMSNRATRLAETMYHTGFDALPQPQLPPSSPSGVQSP